MLNPELNRAPESIRHIYLMGICGTGMAALAGMLQASGYRVSGSDSHVYPPMSDFLKNLNITVHNGYTPDNLSEKPDLVIVGNVITRKNPEAIELLRLALPYLSFPQALSHFFISQRTSLVVAGTHGKTTTCSLLASALNSAALDPTFMIGGIVQEFGSNFRLGKGKYFVAEGDEYDTAFFDKDSKFHHYQPQAAILTSIEFDHADIFADLDAITSSFRRFVGRIPEDGLLIAHLDDPNVADVAQYARCEVQGYGESRSNYWRIHDIVQEGTSTRFHVEKEGTHWGELTVQLPGRHNCLNSVAVAALLNHIGVGIDQMHRGLRNFGGVKRRQEVRGTEAGVTVIDDFAHHPTAVRETLSALRGAYPGRRLVVVFEPRTNSSRRSIFQKDYVESFDSADRILVREPVPIPGLGPGEMFSSKALAADLNQKKAGVAASFDTTDEILTSLQSELQEGDVVAILSNGGFDNIHNRLLEQLRK